MVIRVGSYIMKGNGSVTLGSAQNTFDAGTGDRTAAETLRDNYATANPSWLAEYDANGDLSILLLYTDNGNYVGLYQSRSGGAWYDRSSSVGIRGPQGSEGINYDKIEAINAKADLPSPVSGVITLADNTLYNLGNDIDLGTDRLEFGSNTVLSGLESLVINLNYDGTGDMFTMVDVSNRIINLNITCPNGRLFNWSDSSGAQQLRMAECQFTCDTFGTFSGTQSLLRFTNISPTVTSGGLSFFGTWASLLYETSGITLNGGTMFDLGTATFLSILITQTLTISQASTTFLSGVTSSGNIQTGGEGRIISTQFAGSGTVLSGVTSDDALWEFGFNDAIPNTRPDALQSLQNNTTNTTITTAGVPVLTEGTWTSQRRSQFTNLSTGRSTYNGGKAATVPITCKASIAPVSGQNKLMGAYVAINGVAVVDSKATALTSSGDPTSITVVWQKQLQPNDYVEMFVSNETDTTNVLVSSGIIRIN